MIHIILPDRLAINNLSKFLQALGCLECWKKHVHKYLSLENQMKAENSLPLFYLEVMPKKTNGCLS